MNVKFKIYGLMKYLEINETKIYRNILVISLFRQLLYSIQKNYRTHLQNGIRKLLGWIKLEIM